MGPNSPAPKNVVLGRLLATPGALREVPNDEMIRALDRHQRGDWGEVDEADRQENELSYEKGFRILSAYRTSNDVRFWIITEADRSSTTVLLPEEY